MRNFSSADAFLKNFISQLREADCLIKTSIDGDQIIGENFVAYIGRNQGMVKETIEKKLKRKATIEIAPSQKEGYVLRIELGLTTKDRSI